MHTYNPHTSTHAHTHTHTHIHTQYKEYDGILNPLCISYWQTSCYIIANYGLGILGVIMVLPYFIYACRYTFPWKYLST